MALIKTSMPVPALTRLAPAGVSKYDFAGLQVGEGLIESDFVDAKKAAGRLTSAVSSYKARSGDKRVFTIRTFKQEDGSQAVGVWVTADAPVAAEAA